MFKEAYLRVLTPETTDGISPVFKENGKMKYTESHLHVLAKDMMVRKNAKRPPHLKHIIDVIEVDVPEAPVEKKALTQEEIMAELKKLPPEELKALLGEESKPKKQTA